MDNEDFTLLGVWFTTDKRLAIVTGIDEDGTMLGLVSSNSGKIYKCSWDCDQLSISPFKAVNDLHSKI